MIKLSKIQIHRKSQPKELIKKVESRINRKDKTMLQGLVYKLNRRLTEATLIYFAIAKQKRFEGYLANFRLRL